MQKRGIFIVCLIISSMHIYAQHVSHQVLVPVASVVSTSSYCVSQSIGEVVVQYIHSDNIDLTQGFQQPSTKRFDVVPPNGNGVKVYPNPVKTILTLELFGDLSTKYRLVIFGINGSIYRESTYTCIDKYWHKIPIDVSDFSRGTYFLKVIAFDGTISRLFKVEKM